MIGGSLGRRGSGAGGATARAFLACAVASLIAVPACDRTSGSPAASSTDSSGSQGSFGRSHAQNDNDEEVRHSSSDLRKHVKKLVVIIKENRTFDNLFGRFPGADGATHGRLLSGRRVPLTRAPD